jgi:hypothetical protein
MNALPVLLADLTGERAQPGTALIEAPARSVSNDSWSGLISRGTCRCCAMRAVHIGREHGAALTLFHACDADTHAYGSWYTE